MQIFCIFKSDCLDGGVDKVIRVKKINKIKKERENQRRKIEIRARSYKLFLCSSQLSIKFILLINVKMPTIVGILTFISRINTTSESLKARIIYIFHHFNLNEQLKFNAQLS